MNNVSVLFAGDTHGEFRVLNGVIAELQPDVVLSVGDFGIWRKTDIGRQGEGFTFDDLKPQASRIYFCDGNHENHAMLSALTDEHGFDKPIEVMPNLFYMPRGSVLDLNGHRILFLGGGWSMDQALRTEGINWFADEEFSEADLARVLANPDALSADIVISHTCPVFAIPDVCYAGGLKTEWIMHTETETRLARIAEKLPRLRDWYFGHWHFPGQFRAGPAGTRFHLLNMLPREKSLSALRGSGFTARKLESVRKRVIAEIVGKAH